MRNEDRSEMNFYQELDSFSDFTDLTDDRHYVRIPDNWWIVIADIKDSTRAIEAGRYRDVNTLGAAVIVAVQDCFGQEPFPFSFGGDGASMAIPPERKDAVRGILCALRQLAERQFGLSMRVGMVPVSSLDGVVVEVGKFQIVANRYLAVFRGGGLALAERMVKSDEDRFALKGMGNMPINLDKLSCRWQPVAPKHDVSMALIVRSRAGHPVYAKVLQGVRQILGGHIEDADPVNPEGVGYRGILECLDDEKRYHESVWSLRFLFRVFEIVFAVLVFRHGLPAPFGAKKYVGSMGRHSDYRKFDDSLRMIIDCTFGQVMQIKELLDGLHRDGQIYYGCHESNQTLMTCFFNGPWEGGHLHFIDSGDGGYARAAMNLKKQIDPT